jgi:Tol biopolymer transport system component
MGEVYRAADTRLKREVAIKVLPDALAQDPDRVARFQREAELLASLNHPNIAAVYGLEQAHGLTAIVMELVDGDTLDGRLTPRAIDLDEALAIARQICDALEAAHEKGVIHRDLKPANIKITPEGRVKVLDFGLAKMLETDPKGSALSMSPTLSVHATYAGVILGTAAYMSPEQARGKPVDRRTDVWAFGCVLYEMLTGKHAFEPGETVSDAIASVLTREPDLNTLPAGTPPSIRRLLRRCLQKDPQERLPHIGAARLEIDEARGGSPEEQTAATVVVPATTTRPRGWQRAIPVAAALLAGAAIAGYGVWMLRPEPSRAVTRFVIPLPADHSFTNTGRQVVALSPDGSNLVYVANQRLYLRSMATLEARPIAGSDIAAGLLHPVFSPDSQSLAFYSRADGALKRLGVGGGTPVTICAATDPYGIGWDEFGIVVGQAGKGVLRVSANGGTPEVIAAVGSDQVATSPQMLPGGKTVLFSLKKIADSWDKGQLVVQRLGSGERKVVVDGGADGRYLPTGHLVYAVSGVMFAVPFDPGRLAISGGAVAVVEGVRRGGLTGGQTGAAQFSFSSTGALAYVPGPAKLGAAGERDLALFDRKGAAQPLKLPPDAYSSPRASPDGKAIAFETEDDKEAIVWVYDLGGNSARRRLTFGGKNRWPIWSPDGQWIAFQSDREGDLAIFRQRADGSGVAERLTKPEAGTSHSPQSWSPDGTTLLLTVQKDPQFALWTMTMKDRRMAAFGDVQSIIPTEAAFSADGRWIAYQARASTAEEGGHVFLQPFPSTGAKYLVPRAGGHPYWIAKSGELILNTSPSQSSSIAVTTTPRVEFGKPADFSRLPRTETNPSTSRRSADAMPDGEHVIGVMPTVVVANVAAAAGGSQISVVLNWFDEVRQRVPVK